jgi:hypothetical protein
MPSSYYHNVVKAALRTARETGTTFPVILVAVLLFAGTAVRSSS